MRFASSRVSVPERDRRWRSASPKAAIALRCWPEASLGSPRLSRNWPAPRVSDVSDPDQVERTAAAIERDLGHPSVLIHNPVGGAFGTFREIDPAILNRNFQVNTMGLLYLARRFAPAIIEAGHRALVATRHTSAVGGKPSPA